ncbi:hypothetical protein AHAT_01440 [Agarivorans sp. Toyoura001]|uniref:hypothetical protein n=1 Tax=Agarivorans sp. Toyoura001 TaxID=2283141 RepID=UPI0010D4BA6C|nr:hypothetical protein [Agarivorans sp. Toyoura001]GDY24254.1 hypothetical protein AHAT_01440 [Agarivorans sp. Toyoura001]
MVRSTLTAALLGLTLTSCASVQQDTPKNVSESLIGIWAMLPLKGGIANVVEYSKDGSSTLYPFNCANDNKEQPEVSTYSLSNNDKTIHHQSDKNEFKLEILSLNERMMELEMPLGNKSYNFAYYRVNNVKPLCDLYKKFTPFNASEFTPQLILPAHSKLDHLLGKWSSHSWFNDDKWVIEILKDIDGNYILENTESTHFTYLFNNFKWHNDELRMSAYSYATDPKLFKEKYHKYRRPLSISFNEDPSKLDIHLYEHARKSTIVLRKIEK